jgi:NADPH:quinone reductase-like Zn-dependent oxidoreductase
MSPVSSRAIQFHEHGEPLDVLCENRIDVADPASGRVRIRVIATGLNPADWAICRGFRAGSLPRGIGYDVAGTVDAVGDDVHDAAVGDLVFGTTDFVGEPSAGAADFAILDSWYHIPERLDPIAAAVLPMVVQTAVWTLDGMGLKPGSTLLVNGAGGMVGFAAVQIALRRGVHVIATAGPTFAAQLTQYGAVTTPYGGGMVERVRELAGGSVDLALDTAPPTAGTIRDLIATVANPHHVTTISNHDEARQLGARVNLDHLADVVPAATLLPEYASLAANGDFYIPIASTYPLSQWRAAAELSLSGHPRGKLVLLPNN